MKLTKTIITKFERDVNQYKEYIENKRILGWSKKKRKYVLKIYRPRWWHIKRFKDNYFKKYGKPYKSKRKSYKK